MRRVIRIPALLMLLVTLGAAALVSAGSAHHAIRRQRPLVSARWASTTSTTGLQHRLRIPKPVCRARHRHGTDWTPSPTQRLQPAAAAAIVTIGLVRRVHDRDSTTTSPAIIDTSTSGSDLVRAHCDLPGYQGLVRSQVHRP
jgi:hypothetical protein